MYCIIKKLPLRFWENIWLVCTDEFKSTKYTKYHRIIYTTTNVFKTGMY